MHKKIWLIGHTLSRNGLIDSACQMLDVANAWYDDDYDGESEALRILHGLYSEDRFIDDALWLSLRDEVEDASRPRLLN